MVVILSPIVIMVAILTPIVLMVDIPTHHPKSPKPIGRNSNKFGTPGPITVGLHVLAHQHTSIHQ